MINRIYHRYEKWEDEKLGFYKTTDENKEENITKSTSLLKDRKRLKKYMNMVINKWIISCEQNLSNPAMNRQAYLGQAACCLHHGSPAQTTRIAWNNLTEEEMKIANNIADQIISKWEKKYEEHKQ